MCIYVGSIGRHVSQDHRSIPACCDMYMEDSTNLRESGKNAGTSALLFVPIALHDLSILYYHRSQGIW